MIAATIIAKNEAENIGACLSTLVWCDEIVVVDGGSSDRTMEVAQHFKAKIFPEPNWQGFGAQKNRALDHASADWIISIDADERVTPELAEEIQRVIASPDALNAYSMPRLSSYCGQFMRHSGWYPDRVVRLFRRGTARFSDDVVHERLLTTGPVGQLQNPLIHYSYRSLDDVLDKMNRYSSAGAQKLRERGKRAGVGKALAKSGWAFFRTYVLRRGFLDGRLGFVLACSVAHETWYRYLKLWLSDRPAADPPPPSR